MCPTTVAPASASRSSRPQPNWAIAGPDHQRGVGDPAGDDHVGAGAQALGDAERAEVGVGGQRARHGDGVALDMGHLDGQAEPVGEVAQRVGEAGRVEAAGVGHDAYAAVDGQAERLLHLAQEGLGVPLAGVGQAVAAEDEHGQLGQVVAGEHVERAAGRASPARR